MTLVLSEETGEIRLARGGRLQRAIIEDALGRWALPPV